MKKKKWKTFRHSGVLFAPPHTRKKIGIAVRGRKIKLDALQEEMVYQWAKKKDTPYAKDAVFRRNFTDDLAKELGPGMEGLRYEEIDFSEAFALVDREKLARELMTKEERKELAGKKKVEREGLKAKYGVAEMDGQEVEVGNYMVEPPGIFIGRGDHPLRGRWKPRVGHGDVVLNLDSKAPVPPGDWKEIVHERKSMWLARWKDELTGNRKYLWLADTAGVKQEREKKKYERAVGLSREIGRVRDSMIRDMASQDERRARVATACYLIYRTAMRVGDEKDEEEEADTVGATTLRKEHVTISADSIEFDFLGKDSVRWKESLPVGEGDGRFRENMAKMLADKREDEEIFNGISSSRVNKYLGEIHNTKGEGLTAKVFRTYLASSEVATYLKGNAGIREESARRKIYAAKMANLQAAKRCNHKRTVPKTFESGLKKRMDRLAAKKAARPWEKSEQALVKARQAKRKADGAIQKAKKAAAEVSSMLEDARQAAKDAEIALRKARREERTVPGAEKKGKRSNARTRILALQKRAKGRKGRIAALQKRLKARKDRIATLQKTLVKRKERISNLKEAINEKRRKHKEGVEGAELQIDLVKKTRDYNLGTSLRNYVDPRLFRFWADSVEADWKKLYTASLQKKFLWVDGERGSWKSISAKY